MKSFCSKFNNFTKKNSAQVAITLSLVFSFLYFLTGYWSWFEIAISSIAILAFLCLSIETSFCLLFFLHNFLTSTLVWDLGFTITLIGFCAIMLIKYILGVQNQRYKLNKTVIISFSIALIISLLASINKTVYNGAFLYLTYLPLIYLMISLKDEFNLMKVVNFMLFGFILANIMSFAVQYLPNYGLQFQTYRHQAFSDNPNYLAMRAMFLITFYFTMYFKGKISLLKLFVIFTFSSIIVVLTQSKSSLVLLGLFFIIFLILFLKKDFKKNVKWVGIFVLTLLLLAFILSNSLIEIVNRFIPDKNNIFNSLVTGRDEIWLMYFNECVKNPITILFGNGLLTSEVFIPSQNMARTSHSLYLFLFYRFGIIGCIALGVGFFYLIKKISNKKIHFYESIPLLWFLFISLVDNTFLCFNITFLPLAILLMFDSEHKINN